MRGEKDQYNAVENRIAKMDLQETNEGRMRWYESSSSVASLVGELTEQLRLTLTPTQISKMAGDFRTGKRLNIRKLIPYIASNFKKDKIWHCLTIFSISIKQSHFRNSKNTLELRYFNIDFTKRKD